MSAIFRLTHYRTYHAYRRSLKWITDYLMLAFTIGIVGTFPVKVNQNNLLSNISILMMATYFFAYYWIIAKSRILKRDSRQVMLKVAVSGVISNSWCIYDGVYNQGNQVSLEIAFGQDHSYLRNLVSILRSRKKRAALPPTADDLQNLRFYLNQLNQMGTNEVQLVAYTTVTTELANLLARSGIKVDPISNEYLTKPGRWDYAAATGKLANALWKYPHDFHAYSLSTKPDPKITTRKQQPSKSVRHLMQVVARHSKKHDN